MSVSNESLLSTYFNNRNPLQHILNNALDYIAPPTPSKQDSPSSQPSTPVNSLPARLHAACQSPTSSLIGSTSLADFPAPAQQLINTMRHTLDNTKHELARAHSDVARMEERCRMLEKTLKDTQGKLKARETEIDRMRKEREVLERELSKERGRTGRDAKERKERGVSPPPVVRKQSIHSRHSSLDIRSSSSTATKNGAHVNGNGNLSTSAPSTTYLNTYPNIKEPSSSSSISSASTSGSSSSSSKSSVSTTHPEHTTPLPSSSALSPSMSPSTPSFSSFTPTTSIASTSTPIDPESLARLRSTETFLTRTDSWSGAQVLQAVQDINSGIIQFAASATEVCGFSPRFGAGGNSTPSNQPFYTDTTARLGSAFAHLLGTRDHSQDPILVQLALQACVCICLQRAMGGTTFCVGLPAKTDGVLGVIYKRVKDFEPQPTSAKWRSLTHSHIHAIYPTLAAYAAKELAETIMRWCFDILLLAGCIGIDCSGGAGSPTSTRHPSSSSLSSFSPSSSPTKSRPSASLSTAAKVPLTLPSLAPLLPLTTHITTSLTRLEHVVRQEILSTSFELVGAESGGRWMQGRMVDAFGFVASGIGGGDVGNGKGKGGNHNTNTKVLGCVEIGLVCRTRIGGSNGNGAGPGSGTGANPNTNGTNGVHMVNKSGSMVNGNGVNASIYEERILLMPKVVLESVVDVLDLGP